MDIIVGKSERVRVQLVYMYILNYMSKILQYLCVSETKSSCNRCVFMKTTTFSVSLLLDIYFIDQFIYKLLLFFS